MKKQSLAWVLALVLFLTSPFVQPASAEPFTPADDQQALNWAIDTLMNSVFSIVYSDSTTGYMVRWVKPTQVFLTGVYTQEDLATARRFIQDLNDAVTALPEISLVSTADSANVTVTFAKLDELAGFNDRSYNPGDWASFSYWFENYEIQSANILIASDVTTQEDRNYLLLKKLTGALGLPQPVTAFTDSIITDHWTGAQRLSRLDWMMLNLLYEPRLYPGITGKDALRLLSDGGTASPAPHLPPTNEAVNKGMNPIELTLEELAHYNGKNGQPAYIALDGIIYDVTKSSAWKGGDHHGFEAGYELTQEMKYVSPHGVSKLDNVIAVGKIVVK